MARESAPQHLTNERGIVPTPHHLPKALPATDQAGRITSQVTKITGKFGLEEICQGHQVQPPFGEVLVSRLAQVLQAAVVTRSRNFKPAASAPGCSLPALSLFLPVLIEFFLRGFQVLFPHSFILLHTRNEISFCSRNMKSTFMPLLLSSFSRCNGHSNYKCYIYSIPLPFFGVFPLDSLQIGNNSGQYASHLKISVERYRIPCCHPVNQ